MQQGIKEKDIRDMQKCFEKNVFYYATNSRI